MRYLDAQTCFTTYYCCFRPSSLNELIEEDEEEEFEEDEEDEEEEDELDSDDKGFEEYEEEGQEEQTEDQERVGIKWKDYQVREKIVPELTDEEETEDEEEDKEEDFDTKPGELMFKVPKVRRIWFSFQKLIVCVF